ncbi:serine/threonine-protein kinase [Nocardiopsis dassonvillei]|uniref:non-specific serine/threonine protein kinase n=1 Tax=Nocardiopsis dassonvillei (strain ATCC 23218 / DSM 43111 / CIP 107115 / JCM 7437 / KCTC 9190 / NBRC 14626 / NCTC 10488 / NRRL B-5397 / IMRU 509) TaxID=446468 RepID=D7AYY3_NOCDD|nr:serine/threonine-protein kinase [Nocardiopsis dassonvillei]ADH68145.1 serine/threonine protein kinase [Nocardiopsis dassonvillei subsp. dassonvillei DSM 43111]NKY77209.1 serine/threonine protein kinase [Nocardiopsis dassonvillei]VEI88648.1 Serine/threonine-protein kinase pknB [Nocardiopsis dassonvillei]
MSTPVPGKRLLDGRYELNTTPLGRGGMGEVYEGHDTRLLREVAVKFIRFPADAGDDERAEMVQRFVRESRITAGLQHPGVPAVFDAGADGDKRPYLVMQRVHGVSVTDLVAEQERLSVGWAAGIAAQVCSVLAAAHRASLVHRDLKPGNLMLEADGTVKVLDFGLAVVLDRGDASQITRTGQSPGTPEYMAPEQLMTGRANQRSDLYALGCVLHEMLTGRRLFTASTPFAVASKQTTERPADVRDLCPEVPAELAEVVTALLEKHPEDRPADAVEVYDRLIGCVNAPEPIPGVLHPPSRPNPHLMYGRALSRVVRHVPAEEAAPAGGGSAAPGASRNEGAVPTGESAGSAGRHASGHASRAAEKTGTSSRDGVSVPRREGLRKARTRAAELVGAARYRQAAATLCEAVEHASSVFGPTDSEVVELRLEQANALFEGGNFRQAGPLYAELARDLAQEAGEEDQSLVFRCRFQDATCLAMGGDEEPALNGLASLLDDEIVAYGPDDHRPLELRRQIGVLELTLGRLAEGAGTLRGLRADLVRLHGADHPEVSRIDALLEEAPAPD